MSKEPNTVQPAAGHDPMVCGIGDDYWPICPGCWALATEKQRNVIREEFGLRYDLLNGTKPIEVPYTTGQVR